MSGDAAPRVYHEGPEAVLEQEQELVDELARCVKLEHRDRAMALLNELGRCCYNEGRAYQKTVEKSEGYGSPREEGR